MSDKMTDRELLEYAAKAAGIEIDEIIECEYAQFAGFMLRGTLCWWNPLTDDGDALRLAVKLHLPIQFPFQSDEKMTRGKTVVVWSTCEPFELDEGDDPYAATRRAITTAAAEIGRAA